MEANSAAEIELRQRLEDSQYRYENLFNAMAACFWELDFTAVGSILRQLKEDGLTDLEAYLDDPANVLSLLRATRVMDCNERAVAVFGRGSKDELLTTIDHFWPVESYPVYARSVLASALRRASFSAETRMQTIGGEPRDVLFTACYPNDLTRNGTMLIGIVDLSDTKRALHQARQANIRAETLAEAQEFAFWQLDVSGTNRMLADLRAQGVTDLAAYMEEHPDFVVAALDATIVMDINQNSIELYGLKDKSEAIGKSIRSYWVPERCEAFKGSLAAGFEGRSQFQLVTRTRTVDGRELDCRFWMAAPPEMRANGTVLVAIQDLTEEIASRHEMERLREGLAHAGRVMMLGEFTASIAHEINQPLAALRAASAAARRWLALDPPDLEQAAASLANIARSAHRAGDIIDRVRGMAVKRQPHRETVEIHGLVSEAVDFVSRELHACGTIPTIIMSRGLPEIFVDRTQIQQVLVNLIMNAVQAMEHASSPIRKITISVDFDNERNIVFAVRDRGPGIEPDDAHRLFEHFFTTKEGGMGIGLTICRSIIEAHHGRIAARNVDGGGAEFSFTLPNPIVADEGERRHLDLVGGAATPAAFALRSA